MYYSALHQKPDRLHKIWIFKLSSLALIGIATPAIAVYMHGMIGFFIISLLAIFIGMPDGSLRVVNRNIINGIFNNKFLFVFSCWYVLGLVINLLYRGQGVEVWRFVVGASFFLFGMFYAFAFFYNDRCFRSFQVNLIIILGLQAVYAFTVLYGNRLILREMVMTTQGAWSYGNQSYFALFAIMMPVLIWRALRENGILKGVLLLSCTIIIITITLSTLAMPVALLAIGSTMVAILAVFFPITQNRKIKAIMISVLIISIVLSGYIFTRGKTRFFFFYSKMHYVVQDPASGGYDDSDITKSRWYKAEISLNSFLEAPFWGMGGGSTRSNAYVGGHSSFFDSLGAYGLLGGGGALCGLIATMLIKNTLRFRRERDWESLVGLVSVALLVIAGIGNPYWEGLQPIIVLIMVRPFLKRHNVS